MSLQIYGHFPDAVSVLESNNLPISKISNGLSMISNGSWFKAISSHNWWFDFDAIFSLKQYTAHPPCTISVYRNIFLSDRYATEIFDRQSYTKIITHKKYMNLRGLAIGT